MKSPRYNRHSQHVPSLSSIDIVVLGNTPLLGDRTSIGSSSGRTSRTAPRGDPSNPNAAGFPAAPDYGGHSGRDHPGCHRSAEGLAHRRAAGRGWARRSPQRACAGGRLGWRRRAGNALEVGNPRCCGGDGCSACSRLAPPLGCLPAFLDRYALEAFAPADRSRGLHPSRDQFGPA